MISYPHLQWFPKPFGAGDTDGAGSKKVLGSPEVDPYSLLVREMAQNSWDARLPGVVPLFEMRFRRLDETVRDVLTWNVFGQSWSDNLGLDAALEDPELCAVEVLDRGTRGLGGPTRNDLDPAPGEPSDYADFVLTIGAPPEHGYGGGTYGFGKTAAYIASECSTIVVWSRTTRLDGTRDERFIASAMGSRFTRNAQRYTGRQWWGLPAEVPDTLGVFRVEPACGDDARVLGEAVFERHYEGEETGTSILIIQPKGRESPDQLVRAWARAMTRNLWPKLDATQPREFRMDVRLVREGVDIPLASRETSPAMDAAARCLNVLRRRLGDPSHEDPRVSVSDIWYRSHKRVVGHLALTKYLDEGDDDDACASNAVIYMRSAAELVVRDEPLGPTADGLTRWVAVFKPHPDRDPVFAAAEPPAHDAWIPSGLEDPFDRGLVATALRRSRETAEAFCSPIPVDADTSGSSSTGRLSAALAGLAGGATGSRAVARRMTSGRPGKAAKQPRVDILEAYPVPRTSQDVASERQTTRVTVSLKDSATTTAIRASGLSVAIDGGVMASDGRVLLERWIFDDGSAHYTPEIGLAPGQKVYADISYPVGLAIRVGFTVVDV